MEIDDGENAYITRNDLGELVLKDSELLALSEEGDFKAVAEGYNSAGDYYFDILAKKGTRSIEREVSDEENPGGTKTETVNIYYQYKDAINAITEAKEMFHSEKDSSMREFLNNEISFPLSPTT